jgi:hypothetical protein
MEVEPGMSWHVAGNEKKKAMTTITLDSKHKVGIPSFDVKKAH